MQMPGVNTQVTAEQLIITCPEGWRVCSSAIWNGGFTRIQAILNRRVGNNYCCAEPEKDIQRFILQAGLEPTTTTGLLTAAQVEDVGIQTVDGPEFCLQAIVTAGVGNAARAGRVTQCYAGYRAGTINTIVMIDARVTDAAMLNAIITATEAKTAALQDEGITDTSGYSATGTTTDAIVIAVSNRNHWQSVHPYCGTATELGQALAQSVYQATRTAIRRERERKAGER